MEHEMESGFIQEDLCLRVYGCRVGAGLGPRLFQFMA